MTADRWRLALLMAGAGIGFLLAVWGIAGPGFNRLPDGAVARVGEIVVYRDEYTNLLRILERSKRAPLTVEDRSRVLERMVDERLLVARGVELGLIDSDPLVRKSIANAIIQAATNEALATEPKDEELTQFFRAERRYFARAERFHVRLMRFFDSQSENSREKALQRATQAKKTVTNGQLFATVTAEMSDPQALQTPDILLPEHKLREYIGPTLLRAARQLSPGEVSDPVRSQGGYALVLLVQARRDVEASFAEMRPMVLSEYKRRQSEKSVRNYLKNLRSEIRVVIADDLNDVAE